MAKKAIIANIIAAIGFALGIMAGYLIIQAELYMNPMDYEQSYDGLLFYSYAACSIISCPFLLAQYILTHKKKWLFFYIVMACTIGLIGTSFYDEEVAYATPLTFAWILFPLLVGRLLLQIVKRKLQMGNRITIMDYVARIIKEKPWQKER